MVSGAVGIAPINSHSNCTLLLLFVSHVKLLTLLLFPTSIYPLFVVLTSNHLSSVLLAVASGSLYTYPTTLGMTDPVMFIVLSRCKKKWLVCLSKYYNANIYIKLQ